MKNLLSLLLSFAFPFITFAQTTSITSLNPMSDVRSSHVSVTLNDGKLLVMGGRAGSPGFSSLSSCQLYNPSSGTWSYVPNMAERRSNATAVVLNDGLVLVAGGLDYNTSTYLNSCELYNPATNTWQAAPAMNTSREKHQMQLLPDGKVLACGGAGLSNSSEIFDPNTNTWSYTAPMHESRYEFTLTKLNNGNLIAIGGEDYLTHSNAEIFDIQTKTWTLINSNSVDVRNAHGAALLPNGNILIAGGLSNSSSAEIFNTTTNTFSATSSMNDPKIGCDLIVLDNGNIIGIGLGDIFSTYTNILEEYNATNNTWSSVITTMTGVQYYRMNKMHDGSILVSGGSFAASSSNFLRKVTTNQSGSCSISVSNTCTVQNASVCWGTDGGVSVNASQTGVNYQVFIGSNPVSSIVAGNGSAILLSVAGEHLNLGQNQLKVKASKTSCNSKFLNATLSIQTNLNNTDLPVVSYNGDSINCFNANSTLQSAATSNNIVWSNGLTTPNLTVNQAGYFSYHTINPSGCRSVESNSKELYYYPIDLNVNAGNDFNACIVDDSIPLAGTPAGGLWSGIGISNNPPYLNAMTLTQGQSYELYYERCNVTDTAEVTIDTIANFTYSTNITYSVNPSNSDTFGICSYGNRTISISASIVGVYKRIYLEGNSVAAGSSNVVSFNCPMDSNMVGYAEYVLGCSTIRDTFYIEDRIVDNTPAVYYADTICQQDPAIVTILNSNPNTIYQLYEFGNVYSGYVQGNGDTITITSTGTGPTNFMIIKGNDLSLSCTQNLSYNFSIYSKTSEARISAHSTTDYTSLDTIPLNVDVSNAIGDTFIWALNRIIIDTGLTSSITSNVQGLNEVSLYAISSPGCYDTATISFTIYDLNIATTPFTDNICSTISLDTLSSLIDGVLSTKVAPNGNYIVGGYKQSWGCLGFGATFATLSILDPQGNLLNHYDHSYFVSNKSNHCGSYISDIEIDHNNDIYISGNIGGKEIINYFGFSYDPPSSNDEDIWGYLAKLDMNGNVLWVKITDGVSTSSTSNTIGTSITDVELYSEDAVFISCYSPKNFTANSSRLDVGNGLISMCEINPSNGGVVRKWVAQGDYYVKMFEASRLYGANIYTGRIFIHGPGLINLGCGKIGIKGKFWSIGNNSNLNKLNFDNIQLAPIDATTIVAFADVNQSGALWDSVYTFGSFDANEYGTLANRPQKMKYVNGYYYILNSVSPSYGSTTANIQFDATNQLSGDHFAYLAKYDSLGNFVWHKELRQASYAGFEIVDNEIILIGHTSKFFGTKLSQYSYDGFKTVGRTDWFYAKYDLNGNATGLQQIGGEDVSTSTFYPPLEEFIYQVDYDKCSKKFSILGKLNDQADMLGSTFQTSNNNTSEFIALRLSLGNCTASSCDTTNYYGEVLNISNLSDSLRLCNDDTFEFAPISTLTNASYVFTYWDGTSYIPLNNQQFDYNLNGSTLEIWNVQSETRIKTVATSADICNSVKEKITYIYEPFINITNFPML